LSSRKLKYDIKQKVTNVAHVVDKAIPATPICLMNIMFKVTLRMRLIADAHIVMWEARKEESNLPTICIAKNIGT